MRIPLLCLVALTPVGLRAQDAVRAAEVKRIFMDFDGQLKSSQAEPGRRNMAVTPSVPEQWKPLGRTYNTRYFLPSDDVVIVLPDQGLRDDGASARVNIDFQTGYARLLGRRCAVVVVLDSLTSQDSEARRIYAAGMQPTVFFAAALIVTNPLARAIGSFFLGLTPPAVPTKLFESVEAAMAWVATERPAPVVRA